MCFRSCETGLFFSPITYVFLIELISISKCALNVLSHSVHFLLIEGDVVTYRFSKMNMYGFLSPSRPQMGLVNVIGPVEQQ